MNRESLKAWLVKLFIPVIRLCFQNSLKIQDITDSIKVAYIDCARREYGKDSDKLNITQISLATGIHRNEVIRLLENQPSLRERGLIARILGQWQADRRFCKKGGLPKKLTCSGLNSEFGELVSSVSKSLTPYSILLELERKKMVIRNDGLVELLQPTYRIKDDWDALFRILSLDLSDLVDISTENMEKNDEDTNLHIRTHYDNIVVDSLPDLKRQILIEGTEFHRKMQSIIASYDKDLNSDLISKKGGGIVSLSSFSKIG